MGQLRSGPQYGLPSAIGIRGRHTASLAKVVLSDLERQKVKYLSGGEKQRAAIARAISKHSKILLCDEPTGNLDPETSDEIMKVLKRISEDILVIVVTHNRELAGQYADRVIDLKNGEVVADTGGFLGERAEEYPEEPETKEPSRGKSPRTPWKYIFRFAWLNIKAGTVTAAVVFLLLAAMISLLLCASNMSYYSEASAVAGTFVRHKLYGVPVVGSQERMFTSGPALNKNVISWQTDEDIAALNAELSRIAPECAFGDIYSFGRTFYDFSDAKNLDFGFFHCISFPYFVVIEDFSRFHYPLRCGRYPKTIRRF